MYPSLQQHYQQFYPLKQNNQRKITDVCCLAVYTLLSAIFIFTFFYSYILEKDKNSFKPMDPSGRKCGYGQAAAYPYIYFPQPFSESLDVSVCVTECPLYQNLSELKCLPNALVSECKLNKVNGTNQFLIYNTRKNSLLSLCQPSSSILLNVIDSKIRAHKLFSSLEQVYLSRIVIVFVCPGVCIGLMLLFVLFINICKHMKPLFLGIIVFFFLMMAYLIFLFFLSSTRKQFSLSPVFGVLILVLIGILIFWFISQRNYLMRGLDLASIGTEYVRQNFMLVLVPLIMFGLWALFFIIEVTILIFIYAIASSDSPDSSHYYGFPYFISLHDKHYVIVLLLIAVVHYIWTNLILQHMGKYVSRVGAANWIMYVPKHFKNALYTLFRFHLGSITLGSFLITLLSWLTSVLYLLMPDNNNKLCCCFLQRFSQLYRSEFFRKYLGSYTQLAYIRVGIDGESFNEARYSITPIIVDNIQYINQPYKMAKAVTGIIQLLVAVLSTVICFIVIELSETMKGHVTVYLIIFIISLLLSNFGFDAYNRAFESILLTSIMNTTSKQDLVERVGISHFASEDQDDTRMQTYKKLQKWLEDEKLMHLEDRSTMGTSNN